MADKKKADKKREKEEKREKKKKNSSPVWRTIKLGTKIFFIILLVGGLFLGFLMYQKYGKAILQMQKDAKQLVKQSTTDTFRESETSLVYNNKGGLISTLKGEKDVYYIDYDEIPQSAIDAIIAIEDKKFWKHNGVDLKANVRALVSLVKNKRITQGGSTITQQLARNVFLTHEVTWERKIKEMFFALELEKKYTKKQLMEFYLNNVYFSKGYYGIQAASKGYFNTDVWNLDLAQLTFLCAIPNNPTLYDPIENKENTIKRKNRILKQMEEDGYITKSEYREAKNEEIKLNRKKTKKKNNYVETFVYHNAVKALMAQQGFEFKNEFDSEKEKDSYDEEYTELYNYFQQSLYHNGYRIYTSIDMEKQKKLQAAVDERLQGFTETSEEGIYTLQGAAVCIDNSNGRVVAVVGGRSQETEGYTLNRAYQSYRQPGSAIKPLIVYTPVFELDCYPEKIVVDEAFEGGPRNSDGSYLGSITIRRAVEASRNTIAWKLFEELTPARGLSYLLKMNFARIDRNDYYPATSLGGFTNGVSAVEMAAGFSTLANDGVYREPTCIITITDSEGKEIVADEVKSKEVYQRNAARTMTNVLEGVLVSGTAHGNSIPNMASAGKTGTTNDKKDGWFVGYTPYYTTSVWVGYDMPRTLSDLYGSTYPLNIWYNYMKDIHEGLEPREFLPYESSGYSQEIVPTEEPTQEPTEEPSEEPEEGGVIDFGKPEEDENSNALDGNPDEEEWFENGEDFEDFEQNTDNPDIFQPEGEDNTTQTPEEEEIPDEEDNNDSNIPEDNEDTTPPDTGEGEDNNTEEDDIGSDTGDDNPEDISDTEGEDDISF